MPRHQPRDYACPFCAVVAGRETKHNAQSDVVFRNEKTTALVSPRWWDAAPGHIIVVSNVHIENVYEIDDAILASVYQTAKRMASALKQAHGCQGTSMRQHNEPGGGQDVWHFHVHVFPRSVDDGLYERNRHTRWASEAERAAVAERVRAALRNN